MSKFTKLLELSDYADAKPILETVKGLSEASWTLAQTAYQIKETQPQVARNFLKTVIKECDDEEEKKTQEVDGGKEYQASSTTGLEKVGTEGDADESMTHASDTKDQMGVPIGEMAPPNGMPPQQVPPQVPPQAPPAPPQQQMQYTIQEATAIRNQFSQIKEAINALTKEIKETQNKQVSSLDVGVGTKGTPSKGSFIQETTGNPETDLQKTRLEITRMNDEFNKQR